MLFRFDNSPSCLGLPRLQGGKDSTVHKTRLCERFMTTGSCNYGDKCTFAHG